MNKGVISALWRHPVKGFTPEPVPKALLCTDDFFPFDRLYALEVGRSGFDTENPVTISKMKFAVLARFAAVARLRTRYDEVGDVFEITDEDGKSWAFDLASEAGPEFEVLKPIVRCVATHVNPETAERDVDLCEALWENYGHRDCGIYARIVKGGTVRPGDVLHLY